MDRAVAYNVTKNLYKKQTKHLQTSFSDHLLVQVLRTHLNCKHGLHHHPPPTSMKNKLAEKWQTKLIGQLYMHFAATVAILPL